jgi:dynein heavy chain 1, cytosolic
MKMQQALSEADDRTLPKGASAASRRKSSVLDQSDVRPAWMRQLEQSTKTWQQLLPKTVQALQRTIENIKDPMYRCFEREVNTGLRLLQDVHCDLNDVALVSVQFTDI